MYNLCDFFYDLKALMHLTAILKSDTDQITKAAAVWTLGMIGQHSSENSRSICTGDTITAMIDVRCTKKYKNPRTKWL